MWFEIAKCNNSKELLNSFVRRSALKRKRKPQEKENGDSIVNYAKSRFQIRNVTVISRRGP